MSKEFGKTLGILLLIIFAIINWELVVGLIGLLIFCAIFWTIKIIFF